MPKIERITMFKIPSQSDLDRCLEQYKTLKRTAVKDGKPYVLSIDAGKAACVPFLSFALSVALLFSPVVTRASFRFASLRGAALRCASLTLSALDSDEPRAQGWTLAVKSTFASKADMDYYDNECEAHKELKKVTGAVRTDVCTVWFESVL